MIEKPSKNGQMARSTISAGFRRRWPTAGGLASAVARGYGGQDGGTSRIFNRLTTLFKFEIRISKSEIHLPEAGKNSKL
jgi:hypothetical protein